MEETKKEVIQETVKSETITLSKEDVENLINKKAVEIFGSYLKELNTKPKEEPKQEPKKEITIEDLEF